VNGSYRNSKRGCVPNSYGPEQKPQADAWQLSGLHATRGIIYLAGCPMFPHLPAPISQSCDLSPLIVSISPIFFL